jgi:hypothetical protein
MTTCDDLSAWRGYPARPHWGNTPSRQDHPGGSTGPSRVGVSHCSTRRFVAGRPAHPPRRLRHTARQVHSMQTFILMACSVGTARDQILELHPRSCPFAATLCSSLGSGLPSSFCLRHQSWIRQAGIRRLHRLKSPFDPRLNLILLPLGYLIPVKALLSRQILRLALDQARHALSEPFEMPVWHTTEDYAKTERNVSERKPGTNSPGLDQPSL